MTGPSVYQANESPYAEGALPSSQTVTTLAPVVDHLMIAFVLGTSEAVDVDDGGTWNLDHTVFGGGGVRLLVLSRTAGGSEPTTYTFSSADSHKITSVIMVELDLGDQADRYANLAIDDLTRTRTGTASTAPFTETFDPAPGPWATQAGDLTLSICGLGGVGLDDGGDNDSVYVYPISIVVGPDPGFPDQQGVDENGGWALPGVIGSPGTPGSTWSLVTWKTGTPVDGAFGDFDATSVGDAPTSAFTYGVEPTNGPPDYEDLNVGWTAYLVGARVVPTFNDGAPPDDLGEGHPVDLELEDLL